MNLNKVGAYASGLMAVTTMFALALRTFGWAIFAIWLLCLGDWRVVVLLIPIGIVVGMFMPMIIGLIMMPFAGCTFYVRKSIVGTISVALAIRIIQSAIMIAWCVCCMKLALEVVGLNASNFFPRMLMSYCVAIFPILGDGIQKVNLKDSKLTALFSIVLASIGYLVVVVLILCKVELSTLSIIGILAGFLVLTIPVNIIEVFDFRKNQF